MSSGASEVKARVTEFWKRPLDTSRTTVSSQAMRTGRRAKINI